MFNKESNEIFELGAYTIKLIHCVLNGICAPEPPNAFNWASLKSFTEKHSVSNIAAYAIQSLEIEIPKEIKAYYDEIILHSLAKEAQQEVEMSILIDSFENAKIKHMTMKGFVIKDMYPQANMRSMGDVDILVGQGIDKAEEIMKAHGFNLKSKANLHDLYYKKPALNIELHKFLIDPELISLYSYFGTGFERAKLEKPFSYRYKLSNEDFYVFLIAHIAKHFQKSGTGIRSIIDVWIYRKKLENKLDFNYISKELEKIDLLAFSKKIEKISFDWFEKGKLNEKDFVEEYIISSGVYGDIYNHELNKFIRANKVSKNYKKNKIKYIIKNIFPDLSYMSARYPILKKQKFLLPIFWIVRGFSTLLKNRKNIKYRLKGVIKSKEASTRKFKDSGLN